MSKDASRIASLTGDLVLLGAGRMGSAMLKGWLRAGVDPARIVVLDPAPCAAAKEMIAAHDLRLNPPVEDIAAEVLVVAVKPQALAEALAGLPVSIRETPPLVLTIVAGKPVAAFTRTLGDVPVVRAMPNTPAALAKGITGMYAVPSVSDAQRALARALLTVLGRVVEVAEEADIDKVTAISGSGPAYVFLLTECLAQAARALGLADDAARLLARETVIGAAALLEKESASPADLRHAVTSPGGTTEAALKVLMDRHSGLCPLLEEAAKAAHERARELAGSD